MAKKYEDKKNAAIDDHLAGRANDAKSKGLRIAACDRDDCKAADFYLEGNRRDQKRAVKWGGDHKRHLKG